MRENSSAPEIGDTAIVERVAELYVVAVAGLNLPCVILAANGAWRDSGNRRAPPFDASLGYDT